MVIFSLDDTNVAGILQEWLARKPTIHRQLPTANRTSRLESPPYIGRLG